MVVNYIVLGLLTVALVIILYKLIKSFILKRKVIKSFNRCSVLVYGPKGSGKDTLFQAIINARKKPYYSNISYGGRCKIINPKMLSCEPNTYKNFIENNVTKTNHKLVENVDVYLSDCGSIMTSAEDSALHKSYPSFPLFYNLSRHLYNMNIHCNAQSLDQIWKPIRILADYYICVKETKFMFGLCFTHIVTYEDYNSALMRLRPLKSRFANKYSKAETDKFYSEHGEIDEGWLIQRKSKMVYDARAFEKLLLKGPRKESTKSFKVKKLKKCKRK